MTHFPGERQLQGIKPKWATVAGSSSYFEIAPITGCRRPRGNLNFVLNQRLNMLCIEDCNADRAMIEHFFSRQPAVVDIVVKCSGEAGMDYLDSLVHHHKDPLPDFILCDLNLPGRSGLEILTWCKAQPTLQNIPFFLFSTCSEKWVIDQALAQHADGYFIKPDSIEAFETITHEMFLLLFELHQLRQKRPMFAPTSSCQN